MADGAGAREHAPVRAFASLLAGLVLGGALWVPSSGESESVADVFRQVSPSVVVVRAKGRDVSATGAVNVSETGSGVLVSDGKVITAAHVVNAMDDVTVEFLGGETVRARVVASEPAADLSLLKLARVPSHARVARLANSDGVKVGDRVVVVGTPYGLSHAMSVGWISARWPPNSVYKAMPMAEFFQTDAIINAGNSGGPMFSAAGDVIGIVSHNISKAVGSEGLGFVVSANTARELLLTRPSFWTGLEGQLLTPALGDLFNLPVNTLGFLVKTHAKDSPADAMGIRGGSKLATIDGEPLVVGGDIIVTVNGIRLVTVADAIKARAALKSLATGTAFTVTVLRAGRLLELTGRVP